MSWTENTKYGSGCRLIWRLWIQELSYTAASADRDVFKRNQWLRDEGAPPGFGPQPEAELSISLTHQNITASVHSCWGEELSSNACLCSRSS